MMGRALRCGVGLLALALVVLEAPTAHACSCAPSTIEQELLEADAVFIGVSEGESRSVLRILTRLFDRRGVFDRDFAFRVSGVWRGEVPERVLVSTGRGGGDCGMDFTAGAEYVVFAYGDRFTTTICSNTQLSSSLNTSALGTPRPPQPSIAKWLVLGVLITVALIAAGGLFLWRRRVPSSAPDD